jgi:hypothetical protein
MRKLLLLLCWSSLIFADFDKVATTNAQFLKFGVGPRAMGMGGGFVALANDGTATYWNPAGLTSLKTMTSTLSHNTWVLDIKHDFLSLVLPTRENEWIGLSASSLTMGEQLVRTELDPDPEPDGLTYGVSDMAIGVSYARLITDRLSFGITGKFIHLTAYNEKASAMAIDIGSILRTDFYGLKIGMALSNFGNDLKYEGRDLIVKADIDDDLEGNYLNDADLQTEPWPLPLMFRIGVAMDLIGVGDAVLQSDVSRMTFTLDADHPNDGPEHLNFGVEYGFRELIFLRGGYRHNYDLETFSMGVGIKIPLSGSNRIKLDYAVKPMDVFGNTSILSIEYSR